MTKRTNVIVLRDVRIAFPHVYEPVRPYGTEAETEEDVSKKKEWSAQIRISKEQFDQVKELIGRVAQEKWGQKATQMLKKIATNSPKNMCCREFEDENTGETYYAINAKRKEYRGKNGQGGKNFPPQTLGLDWRRATTEDDPEAITDGCVANVKLSFFCYDQVVTGVGCDLCALQFLKSGEPFGKGGVRVEDGDFPDLSAQSTVGNMPENEEDPW